MRDKRANHYANQASLKKKKKARIKKISNISVSQLTEIKELLYGQRTWMKLRIVIQPMAISSVRYGCSSSYVSKKSHESHFWDVYKLMTSFHTARRSFVPSDFDDAGLQT